MLTGTGPTRSRRAFDVARPARRSRAERLHVRGACRHGHADGPLLGDRRRHRRAQGAAARASADVMRLLIGIGPEAPRARGRGRSAPTREEDQDSRLPGIASTTPRSARDAPQDVQDLGERRQSAGSCRGASSARHRREELMREAWTSTRRPHATRSESPSISLRRSSPSARLGWTALPRAMPGQPASARARTTSARRIRSLPAARRPITDIRWWMSAHRTSDIEKRQQNCLSKPWHRNEPYLASPTLPSTTEMYRALVERDQSFEGSSSPA